MAFRKGWFVCMGVIYLYGCDLFIWVWFVYMGVFFVGDKDPSAVVTVPDNLSTTPITTPTAVAGQHILMGGASPPTAASTSCAMATGGTMATGGSRPDEEDIGERGVWFCLLRC